MSLVFLIGMPAAGKTYWGEKIAANYGFEFIDIDKYIEQAEGDTITALFERYKEPAFRIKEKDALETIIATGKTAVIACGGGTPCYYNNMQHMLQAGIVIYLCTALPVLQQRIINQHGARPLFADAAATMQLLTNLLAAREHVYQQAHYILNTGNISLATFTQILDHV